MPESRAMVNTTEEIISDLLRAAEKLRMEGEREASCCCIEAVFVLLGQEPKRISGQAAWTDELEGVMVAH
jgi:hypothetical protein